MRIAGYRDLPNQSPSETFVVEGRHLVERLIASNVTTHSILVKTSLADEYAQLAGGNFHFYVADEQVLSEIVGFQFHRGVLALGVHPPKCEIETAIPASPTHCLLAVCVGVQNRENLGGILRNAAALGCCGMLLDTTSADPFARRSLRVSMGAPLFFPTEVTGDIANRLQQIRESCRLKIVAATLNSEATPLIQAEKFERIAVLLGSEAHGLPNELVALCDAEVTIPMAVNSDSLNVASASAILFHHVTSRWQVLRR